MKGIFLAGVLIFQVPVIFILLSFNFWLRLSIMSDLMEFLWETGMGENDLCKSASEECYSEVNSLF